MSVLMTFLAVVGAWVVFRSDNINTATAILKSMAGINGFALPDSWLPKWGVFGEWLTQQGVHFSNTHALIKNGAINWILVCLLIVWFAPNTQQMMVNFKPALNMPEGSSAKLLLWQSSYAWLVASVVCAVLSILLISELSEFIYFQF